jgi:hypothetical protein
MHSSALSRFGRVSECTRAGRDSALWMDLLLKHRPNIAQIPVVHHSLFVPTGSLSNAAHNAEPKGFL